VNTPILEVRPEAVSEERKAAMLQPEDIARAVVFIATLPAHVSIPELIINVNSVSGKRASPLGGTAYIAAKFGLRGMALGVAAEEKDNGIRVSSIYPGEVNTPILEVRPEPVSDQRKAAMLQPEDVARAVLFIATLPEHVAIPELLITPANATYL